jgi:molybdopterin molybdotransferase
VTTGGASVGEHDLVQKALGRDGFVLDFWQIAMRPGKPLIWGRLGAVPVLGLPGNPVSSLVCGIVFLWPAIAALGGRPNLLPPLRPARLQEPLAENDRREDYLRARLSSGEDGMLRRRPSRSKTAPC